MRYILPSSSHLELSALWQESADRESKIMGFKCLVKRLSPQYALWGLKDERNHQELAKLTQASTSLIDQEIPMKLWCMMTCDNFSSATKRDK